MSVKQEPHPTPYIKSIWDGSSILLGKAARNKVFRGCYAVLAVMVLFGTALLWAALGAHLQTHNADQLSDPYLFSNWATFHGAAFPGSHTFLLKWPIFWLIHVFGVSSSSLVVATVSVVLVTIAALAFVLYKIDRRPLVFGTVCLSLSLALLLVPAQPYAGGLLPVNMAMLTTRNIEYAVYIAALALFARFRRVKSWGFIAGVLLLAVLIASDKLFLSLSLGGSLLALVAYAALRTWNLVTFAVRWLVGSIVAAAGALAILAAISAVHLTHLVDSVSATPYGLASGAKDVMLGVAYSVLGLLTNTGANPAYDNVVLRQLPHSLMHRLWSFSGPAYVAAAVALLYALLLAWRLAWCDPKTKPRAAVPVASMLALALVWSTVAAFGVFIATNHYYAVDARYLTIGLFALVITTSIELRKHHWRRPERLLAVAGVLLAAITVAAFTSVHISDDQSAALKTTSGRNSTIATALQQHKVDVLVGDYWRVLPIKLALHGSVTAMPLSGCTRPTAALTSSTWQPNLRTHSFAYLLTISGSLTDFPSCSVATVVAAYGRPNATQIISGTLAKPTEALLFYDRGSHPPVPAKESAAPASASILPVTPNSLTDVGCMGPTIMNVVAHEDDDLLFLSPDLLHEIHVGNCVRTVFLTAGDDGQDRLYWLSRQLGSEAAYNSMLGKNYVWLQQTVKLARDEYVTTASPRGDPKITLVFFNLPDGNLTGQGFPATGFQSLAKLRGGAISSMQTVDHQSTYTAPQLVAALAQLMQLYRPSEIHTQADVTDTQYADHSDHRTAGMFAGAAATAYDQEEFAGEVTTPFKRYIGYPIHGYSSNVSGSDLAEKQAAFFAYGQYDSGTCRSAAACQTTTYGFYLSRQYQQ